MSRYFLHLRYPAPDDGFVQDDEGDELSNPGGLRQHVVETARDLMRNARLRVIHDCLKCSFEVTDEAGTVVMTLPFSEVIG